MSIDDLVAQQRREKLGGHVYYTAAAFMAVDILAILASFGFGFFIVNAYDLAIINFKSFVTYWPYLPAFILVFYGSHLYPGIALAPAEELRRFGISSFFGHAGIILSLYLQKHELDAYSVAFALSWIASLPGLALGRALARSLAKRQRWWGIPVVIFGAGKTGTMVVDRLLRHPWIGYRPVAILDDDPRLAGNYREVPILTGTALGPELARKLGIATAIVAMPGVDRHRLYEIIASSVQAYRYYLLIPDFFGMSNLWMSVRDLDGVLGLATNQRLLMPWNRFLKRFLDIVLALSGGLLILPVVGLIGLLIKLESRGPMFYGHARLGRGGKPFKSWKFRSMVMDADRALKDLLERDPSARAEWVESFKLRKDPRITKIGSFLRKTSLDELPQIWNVIRGEMSLIGPRPIVKDEVPKYGEYYKIFSTVRPGMSGLWQVSGRSDTSYDERVALDVYYIQSWSIWLDLHILLRTFGVFFGKGAY